ncbi:hypothetical protein STAN_3635 [Streptomyces sp. CBMAI 2042]|nr:hypothetical protein STAN_3635 [Streptomyces sp. CBMAI 2042]
MHRPFQRDQFPAHTGGSGLDGDRGHGAGDLDRLVRFLGGCGGGRLPGHVHPPVSAGRVQVWGTRENGAAATAATGQKVWQYGPGLLWEEIEQTWWEYETAGRPDAEQFGLTVTDRGQQVWLRDPSAVIRPSRR